MTQYKDIVEKQNQKIKQEKENNTLTSIGWQREATIIELSMSIAINAKNLTQKHWRIYDTYSR